MPRLHDIVLTGLGYVFCMHCRLRWSPLLAPFGGECSNDPGEVPSSWMAL